MLQVILLTAVSISTLLKVSKEDKRLWVGHSPGLFFPLLFSISSSPLGRSVLIVAERICNSDAELAFTEWVQLLQGAINNALVKLACVRVIVVVKAISLTPYLLLGVHSVPTGRSTSRWWRRSVLAPVCLWKYLFCTEVGRDRREQRWSRLSVFAHADMVVFFFFFCVYSDMEEVEPENPKASLKCLNEVH